MGQRLVCVFQTVVICPHNRPAVSDAVVSAVDLFKQPKGMLVFIREIHQLWRVQPKLRQGQEGQMYGNHLRLRIMPCINHDLAVPEIQ